MQKELAGRLAITTESQKGFRYVPYENQQRRNTTTSSSAVFWRGLVILLVLYILYGWFQGEVVTSKSRRR